jgi:hypothetical protein
MTLDRQRLEAHYMQVSQNMVHLAAHYEQEAFVLAADKARNQRDLEGLYENLKSRHLPQESDYVLELTAMAFTALASAAFQLSFWAVFTLTSAVFLGSFFAISYLQQSKERQLLGPLSEDELKLYDALENWQRLGRDIIIYDAKLRYLQAEVNGAEAQAELAPVNAARIIN